MANSIVKEYLFTPGPTWIPERIFRAMAQPTMHHRTDVFTEHFNSALKGFQWLVEATETPIFLSCSGTGAMEAALVNICGPGEKVLYLNGGAFGARWGQIAARLGLVAVEVKVSEGASLSDDQLRSTLAAHPDAVAFLCQYSETSTGVLHPVPRFSAILAEHAPQMLFIVDAISALVTVPVSLSAFKIDVLIGASQKAFMLPPGLSMLALSRRAWERVGSRTPSSLYFDLKTERAAHEKGTTAWTPAMNLILGFNEAIAMFREEGLEQVYARHRLNAQACRAGLTALGCTLLAPEYPGAGVTAAYPPTGASAERIVSLMVSQSGVRIAGGQGALAGKIVRAGHMGFINRFDIITLLSAFDLCLTQLNVAHARAAGVAAALEVFESVPE